MMSGQQTPDGFAELQHVGPYRDPKVGASAVSSRGGPQVSRAALVTRRQVSGHVRGGQDQICSIVPGASPRHRTARQQTWSRRGRARRIQGLVATVVVGSDSLEVWNVGVERLRDGTAVSTGSATKVLRQHRGAGGRRAPRDLAIRTARMAGTARPAWPNEDC